MKHLYRPILFFGFLGLLATACVREYFQASRVQLADWPAELGIPVLNSEINTDRLIARLDDGELIVPKDPDGRVSLWQTGQLFSIQANEIVSFPDTGNALTIPGVVMIGSPLRTTEQYAFNAPNGMKVEHLKLRSGEAYLRIVSTFDKPGNVRVEIPALANDVESYDESLDFVVDTTGPSIQEKVIDISGYEFDFTQATPAYNRFNYDITLTMDQGLPNFSDSLVLEFGYRNLSFVFMDGDFGQQVVSLDEDSIFLPLFDAFGEGVVQFNDLEFEFEVINSFGFPIDVNFLKLEALDVGASFPTPWVPVGTVDSFPQPFSLNYPPYGEFTGKRTTTLAMNRTNSNINEMIGDKPKWIYHQIEATSNADSNTALDFMTDTSGFTVNSTVKIPLSGDINQMTLLDTADFSMPYTLDKIDRLDLKLAAVNSFPLAATVFIELHNDNFTQSTSLVSNFEVGKGSDASPFNNTEEPIVFSLSKEEVEELQNYSQAIITVILDSEGDVVVRDHEFILRAGVVLINE